LSSLNSELFREGEWQAEMDRYDYLRARADAIIERQRREELEDNDIIDTQSNTKLSVLASSIFNGIDGTDGIDGMDSIKSSSQDHGVDSRVIVQGIGISPRRTRSGKVVKYRDN
jgi:hypothetical protein